VGTNRSDLLFGVPATSLPTGVITGAPSSIPEIPLVKRTAQQGVCKLAVYAYDRGSGRPLWQSGTRQIASQTKDIWIFGAGPFTRGTIHDGTHLAGEQLAKKKPRGKDDSVWVAHEILFPEQPRAVQGLAQGPALGPAQGPPFGVIQASANGPVMGPLGPSGAAGSSGIAASPGPLPGPDASYGAPASPPNSTGPNSSGPSPSGSVTTSSGPAGGSSSTAGSGSTAAGSPGATSGSGTTGSANPVAGAVGAMDWAQTMLGNNHANSTAAAPQPLPPVQSPSILGQTPAALRPKGP